MILAFKSMVTRFCRQNVIEFDGESGYHVMLTSKSIDTPRLVPIFGMIVYGTKAWSTSGVNLVSKYRL